MKTFSHSFDLDLGPSEAFPLFTPKGEELWVPDWRPEYIEPQSGETVAGMVFRTGDGEESTIWTCLEYDPRARHARYLRVTPASRVAWVDVACAPHGGGGTTVQVSYSFVPLTASGDTYVSNMSDASFATMIGDWKGLIERSLPAAQARQ